MSEPAIDSVVEYDDTVAVEPEYAEDESAVSPYPALGERQRRRIVDSLRDSYSDSAVDAVLGTVWDWKLTSYANHARTHERLFRSALGVQSSERDGGLVCRAPRGEEGGIALGLHQLTQSFVERHFGPQVTVYRGLDVSVEQLVPDLLDDPARTSYTIENPPVFVNFTTRECVAREYGFLVVGAEIPRDAVGLAADFVTPYVQNGRIRKRDAELRVRGDRLPAIEESRITLPSTGRRVVAAFRDPGDLTAAEHRDVLDLVMRVDARGTGDEVTTERGRELLDQWLRAYRRESGAEGRYEATSAAAAIERTTR